MVRRLSRYISLVWIILCGANAFAKHGEIDVPFDDGSFRTCERLLTNLDHLHGRLLEPKDPDDPLGFVTDAYPLTVDTMVRAGLNGLYAMQESERRPGHPVLVKPKLRGLMFLDPDDPDAGISKRDLRTIRKLRAEGYTVRFDTDFAAVVEGCRWQQRVRALEPRKWRRPKTGILIENPTWITPLFAEVFLEMHVLQHAHSVEVYYKNEQVAGLFGTFVGGVFTGESMYYRPGVGSNAAKLALWALRRRLLMKGHRAIDTQTVVGLIKDWGGVLRPDAEYMQLRQDHAAQDLSF